MTDRIAVCALLALLTCSCETYPERTRSAYSAFREGHLAYAVDSYADPFLTGSDFLAGAESGTVALAAGDWPTAIRMFDRSVARMRQLEYEAEAFSGRSLADAGAWAFDHPSLDYYGEGIERAQVHTSLAVAFLAVGRLDSVRLEARRALTVLAREERIHGRELRAGGLARFVSCIAYEVAGGLNEAYVGYREMVEEGVGEEVAGRALVRLATRLGDAEALPELVRRFGPDYERPEDSASIVVVAGIGLGPTKAPTTRALDGAPRKWRVPEYQALPQPVEALELRVGSVALRTAELEDVAGLVAANLDDRLAWLAQRSDRAVLDVGLTVPPESDRGGPRFAASVDALFDEADLRAWQTMPASWHAARVFVPGGVHRLELQAVGGDSAELGTFELLPGETMVIVARTVEQALYAYPIGGLELNEAARDVAP